MKAFIAIILVTGALFLPAAQGVREAAVTLLKAVATSIEQTVIRSDYAEVRTVDGPEFDMVINEPGRLVIVVIENEMTTTSQSQRHELSEKIKKLPGKVLVAKIIAERNEELLRRLRIPAVPNIRIYSGGRLLREFKGDIDREEFLKVVHHYVDNPAATEKVSGGYIGPLEEDWVPEGVEKKHDSSEKAPVSKFD